MRSWHEIGRFFLAIACVTATACGDDVDMMADGGTDSGPPPMCDEPTPLMTGDANGHADPMGAGAGEARAGRIEESELPEDRTGLAVWAAGDFVLANEHVAVIIEDAGDSDLYDPFGGRIVGVASREGGELIAADFNEILFGFGAFLVGTQQVTVLSDGSDGGAAVVRASGPLAGIDFAGDLLTSLVPGDFAGWPAAIDYRLEPGADRVTVTLHVIESSARNVRVPMILEAFFQGSRMGMWSPLDGFDELSEGTPYVAFDDPTGGASYVWEAPEDKRLSQVIDQAGVLVTQIGPLQVMACSTVEVPLGSMVVGRTLDAAQASARTALGETLRTITGTVLEADGTPASDVRVHVTTGETHHGRTRPDATGNVSMQIPDADVEVWGYRRGTPIVGPIAVPRGTSTFALEMPALGTIEIEASDASSGDLVPARVQAFAVGGSVMRPADNWGEQGVVTDRAQVVFAGADGKASMRLAPGTWSIVVSRGFEHELVEQTVTLAAGATEVVLAALERSVDTTGVLCADYHIHTTRSPDADDDASIKMLSLVADGVEIAVRSDHEFVSDFGPTVTELGLGDFVLGLAGEELTTFQWGHFGVFPMVPDPSRPNGGAPRWPGKLAPQLFDEVRALASAPALIINHPRSGGTTQGYFNAAGYDADTGMVSRMQHWDEEFSIVEVFNDSSFDQNLDGTVADWFSLLRNGRRVFAVGSSDSHHIHSAPVGYPRTCLALGTDDPSIVTPNQVRDATSAGQSVISGGIYMDIEAAGGVGPGGEVTSSGERAMIHVVVRAASWIDVDRLEVFVDGTSVETIPIAASMDPVRLDEMIEAPIAAPGSFVVIVASGDEELEPVHRGRTPFAVSNPIFFRR